MPVIVNNMARPVTVSHRIEGVINKLVLNPGVNEISAEDRKLYESCAYISQLVKAKKIELAKSVDAVDIDGMPVSSAKSKKAKAGK